MLAMPLKNVDLSVKLPPGLQLAATAAGLLDCRMQLMGVQMEWPATGKYILPCCVLFACQHSRAGSILLFTAEACIGIVLVVRCVRSFTRVQLLINHLCCFLQVQRSRKLGPKCCQHAPAWQALLAALVR